MSDYDETMSDTSLARTLRAVVACRGRVTDAYLPDGFAADFITFAKPYRLNFPTRVNVGHHNYRCGVDGCTDVCPPTHHGGEEWRQGTRVTT